MILSFIKDKTVVFLYFVLYNSRFSPHIDSLNIRLSLNRQYSKLEATPPPSLFSRVYIRIKKIPYLFIYIMYILHSGGERYVSFEYWRFNESQTLSQSAHKTHRNPTTPNENKLFPNFPNETKGSPTRPLCDVVSLHRDSRKMRTIPNSSRRLVVFQVDPTKQPNNKITKQPNKFNQSERGNHDNEGDLSQKKLAFNPIY